MVNQFEEVFTLYPDQDLTAPETRSYSIESHPGTRAHALLTPYGQPGSTDGDQPNTGPAAH